MPDSSCALCAFANQPLVASINKLQLLQRRAAINRICRELRALTQISSRPTQEQAQPPHSSPPAPSLHPCAIPSSTALTISRIRLSIATTQMIERSNFKPKVARLDLKSLHFSVLRFRNMRLARQRDFIQSVFTMDHPRALSAKRRQHLQQVSPPDPFATRR